MRRFLPFLVAAFCLAAMQAAVAPIAWLGRLFVGLPPGGGGGLRGAIGLRVG